MPNKRESVDTELDVARSHLVEILGSEISDKIMSKLNAAEIVIVSGKIDKAFTPGVLGVVDGGCVSDNTVSILVTGEIPVELRTLGHAVALKVVQEVL